MVSMGSMPDHIRCW